MSMNEKLDGILNGYKVGELKELAKVAGVSGYSKLKKAELVEAVANQLQTVDVSTLDIADDIKEAVKPAKKKESKKEEPAKKSNIVGAAPHTMNVGNAQNNVPFTRPAGSRKIYPNEPCPCGSGMKYKRCCGKR